MKKPNIAVLGATGVVGRHILEIMQNMHIEYENLKLLSSVKSAGTKMTVNGREYTLEEAKPESFDDVNIVLASAGASTSKLFAPEIVKRGGVLIDNSSAFRMEKDVPLVIVGMNDEDLKNHKGIISNPNCSTSQLILPVKFVQPIAFNVIPQIDSFTENGYTKEEMKVVNETKKIMHLDSDVQISCTAARVPVFVSHSEAVDVEFVENISVVEARNALSNSFGVTVVDDIDNMKFPTAIQAEGKDPVYVGRIRQNLAFGNKGLSFWCVGDNLRIGAALNTVRICKRVTEMELF